MSSNSRAQSPRNPDESKQKLTGTIGTPTKEKTRFHNILRPYFGKYRSPLRAKIRFGKQTYPWQTHTKKWPQLSFLTINFFIRKALDYPQESNLYERLHPLPLRGIGSIVKSNTYSNEYYIIRDIRYKLRPFQGKISADMYIAGNLALKNINPRGTMNTNWIISNSENINNEFVRKPFPHLYNPLNNKSNSTHG